MYIIYFTSMKSYISSRLLHTMRNKSDMRGASFGIGSLYTICEVFFRRKSYSLALYKLWVVYGRLTDLIPTLIYKWVVRVRIYFKYYKSIHDYKFIEVIQ